MSTPHTSDQGATIRVPTPPIPVETLSLVYRVSGLDGHQLRRFFDSIIPDCDIRNFYGAMIDAIRSNNVFLVKELLRYKMPVSQIFVVEATKAKAKDILTLFFENGWDINKPMDEMSPPMLANALEDVKMTTWLLDRGADPNARCNIDNTPLSYAVKYADLPTIDLLLHRGGDVRKGQLVHNAIYRESDTLKVVEMLIDQGASLNSLMYQDHQASRNMFPFMGETPLHTAVALKRGDVVRYLIRKGASVQIKDHKGETVLQCSDENTRDVIMQEIQSYSMLHVSR